MVAMTPERALGRGRDVVAQHRLHDTSWSRLRGKSAPYSGKTIFSPGHLYPEDLI